MEMEVSEQKYVIHSHQKTYARTLDKNTVLSFSLKDEL